MEILASEVLGTSRFDQCVISMALVNLCNQASELGQEMQQRYNAWKAESDEAINNPWQDLHQFSIFIPDMVERRNRYLLDKATNQALISLVSPHSPHPSSHLAQPKPEQKSQDPLIQLLQVAAENNNTLSVAQAMISLDLPLEEAEKLLGKAVKKHLAHIGNDPDSGAVRYYFDI